MRFTSSNALIASTVALLSLITPVVRAATATITSPAAGQTLQAFGSVQVEWTITTNQDLTGVLCNIGLLHPIGNPAAPASPGILQTNVPILNGQSTGPVTIPNLAATTEYFLQLLSLDGNTVFGESGLFKIV